jgi:hypothetical protein
MKLSRRIAVIAAGQVSQFVAGAAERAAQAEHSWKRTDRGNSPVARAAPGFQTLKIDRIFEALMIMSGTSAPDAKRRPLAPRR